MKTGIKRALSVVLLLAMVAIYVAFLARALAMQDGPEKNGAFLREDRQYDVLLFGSSHMVNGIYPMQLWKDYGITAYNLSGHGSSLATSYWTLRLAVEYRKPKVAVLDVLFAQSNTKSMDISLAHELLDPFPLSKRKIEAIRDLYEADSQRAELLFPLDVYHNRWKDLDGAMVRRGLTGETDLSPEKGAQARIDVVPTEAGEKIPRTQCMEEKTVALEYVEKFVVFCLENDIVPVLTYLPCEISPEWQESCNAALALGESLGAEIVDMQHMDLLNDETDWYDAGGHLNPSGAKKTTRCLGDFLRDRLSLPDHRQEDLTAADWGGDYTRYLAYLGGRFGELETLPQLLSLGTIDDFAVELWVGPGAALDLLTLQQLRQMGEKTRLYAGKEASVVSVKVSGPNGQVLAEKRFSMALRENS